MSILTGPAIAETVRRTREVMSRPDGDYWKETLNLYGPGIDITPFDPDDPDRVGPNSVDVHLADKLLVYSPLGRTDYFNAKGEQCWGPVLDSRNANHTYEIPIPADGLILVPGKLYLGSTVEKTACCGFVPWLDGRSSIGRLGIFIHATAGRGDDGFGWPHGCNWTLEISVVEPVRIYPGLKIGQITFFQISGQRKPYTGRYQKQDGPTASRLWQDGDK